MSWKTILKETRMDNDASCCEEARMKIVEWFEEQAEVVSSIKNFKKGLENMSVEFSEYPCEELYEKITSYIHTITQAEELFLDIESLEKIVNDWDKCKEEPMADKEPVKDTNKYRPYAGMNDDVDARMRSYLANREA
jgi:hypothetical protein